MLSVLVILSLSCGCVSAVAEDCGAYVACTADVRRGWWWCECADPEDPRECGHVDALLFLLTASNRP